MKPFRLMRVFNAPVLLSLTLAAGCGAREVAPMVDPLTPYPAVGAQTQAQEPTVETPQGAELQVSLQTDKARYRRGETVNMTIIARNPSATPIQTTVGGRKFDVTATADNSKAVVWRWSQGRAFTMEIRDVTVAPGGELRYTATWDGKTSTDDGAPGTLVAAGRYVLQGKITSSGGIDAPPVTVELAE